jgi:hypothetical protein
MSYPSGLKIFIDGVDCTYYIFNANTFDPDSDNNIFRDINITPFLRKPTSPMKMKDRNYQSMQNSDLHTVEITAQDGNGRVECRVEVR